MNLKHFLTASFLSCFIFYAPHLFAQEHTVKPSVKDSTKATANTSSKKEEANRNVMLNAESNAGPRFIQIGIPTGSAVDVPTILENDMPVVYYFFPRNPNTFWRAGSGLSNIGVLKISEVAITTGRVGYGVNSYTRKGQDKFAGLVNYGVNHFGMQRFDMNISGKLAKELNYSASVYQMFDPGSAKLPYSEFQDRAAIYTGTLTKYFNDRKGELSLNYRKSNAYSLSFLSSYTPFIYNGDGSISELPGMPLGTTNISPVDGTVTYKDMLTGEMKSTTYRDAAKTDVNQAMATFNYKYDNGLKLKVNAMYSNSDAGLTLSLPTSIITSENVQSSANIYTYPGTTDRYTGDVLNRLSLLDRAKINDAFMVAELNKKIGNHNWRIGINEMFTHVDHHASSVQFSQEIKKDPSRLDRNGTSFYNYNTNGEYYKGYEQKTALYFTDDWDISSKLNIYYGARLEYMKMDVDYLPHARFNGVYVGATNPVTNEVSSIVNYHTQRINPILTAALVYKLAPKYGITGEFTYNVQNPTLVNYAGSQVPITKNSTVPLGRIGVYYTSDKFSLVSAYSMIKKTNYFTRFNLSDPNGSGQVETVGTAYDVQTFGWTTDIVTKPFKNFNFHFLFTYQNPQYKNFNVDAFGGTYSFNDKTVTGQSKILMEIDPSYQITKDLRAWSSFRYFGKQTANLSNALYFNGRWETFGGLNWTINKNVNVGGTVINFLNQTGAKGSISGAELITDPSIYQDYLMAGQYIRPFTVEFSLGVKF
jgi:hypothetical protein